MSDLISRQATIDALNKMKIYRPLDSDRYVISDCLNKIVNLPSAQQWIPCSEQMPPMDKYVLVCTVDGDITDGQRWDEDDDGTWFIFGDSHSASDGDIVAWMPLPEPYKDGEQND